MKELSLFVVTEDDGLCICLGDCLWLIDGVIESAGVLILGVAT